MNMKKFNYIIFTVLAVVGVVTMSSCKKDTFSGRLMLTAEGYQSNDKVAVDGTTTIWATGDKVNLNGITYPVTVSDGKAYVNASESVATADTIYGYTPVSMVSNYSAKDTQTVFIPAEYPSSYDNSGRQIISMPMAARAKMSGSGTVEFSHITGAILVRVKNETANDLYLERVTVRHSLYRLNGKIRVNFNSANLGINTEANGAPAEQKTVSVTFEDEVTSIPSGQIKDVIVPVRPFSQSGMLTIEVYSHNKKEVGMAAVPSYVFSLTESNYPAIARNEMMIAQIQISPLSNHVTCPTAFSVSDTKKVFISKSNLMYTPNNNTFAFHTNAYDIAPQNNIAGSYTSTSTTPIDLFGWATSGYQQHNSRPAYHPYDVYKNSGNYGPNDNNTNINNVNKGDWGWNINGIWRTLSQVEWSYLYSRSTRLRTRATVNGTPGLILFPDAWDASNCSVSYTPDATSYGTNNISATDWETMQSLGAIFLPTAGYRYNASSDTYCTSIGARDVSGLYWTSSAEGSNSGLAWRFMFGESTWNNTNSLNRSYGLSVRLVCDAD
jgi:hypothetical protein